MKKLATTLLLTSLMSTAAFAQQDEFYIKITGGGAYLGDVKIKPTYDDANFKNFGGKDDKNDEYTLKKGDGMFSGMFGTIGGGLGYYLSDKFRVELTLNFQFSTDYSYTSGTKKTSEAFVSRDSSGAIKSNLKYADGSELTPTYTSTAGTGALATGPEVRDLYAALLNDNAKDELNSITIKLHDMTVSSVFAAGYFDIVDVDQVKVFVGGGIGGSYISGKLKSEMNLGKNTKTAFDNHNKTKMMSEALSLPGGAWPANTTATTYTATAGSNPTITSPVYTATALTGDAVTTFNNKNVERTAGKKIAYKHEVDYTNEGTINLAFKVGGGISIPVSENAFVDLGYEYVNLGKGIGKNAKIAAKDSDTGKDIESANFELKDSTISAHEIKAAIRFTF